MVSVMRRVFPGLPGPSPDAIVAQAKMHLGVQRSILDDDPATTRPGLNTLHTYVLGTQAHPSIPAGASREILEIAKRSRVNILDLIVSSVAQSMYVDGYRLPVRPGTDPEQAAADATDPDREAPAWEIWQANKMDAGQIAIHRAALTYGWCYATVLPGTLGEQDMPVIRGWSPRQMIAMYGNDPDWPLSALSMEPSASGWALRLYDTERIWNLAADNLDGDGIELLDWQEHGAGVVPVIQYRNVNDLDGDQMGEIERLLPLQDQINDTTFELRVAQKYAAFRQRYVLGWTTTAEDEKVKASASRLWLFEDADVKVGEFSQTELTGYLESREASLRHAASLSQTPAHELIGQLVNLSAEALMAAEVSQRRKVTERAMSFGESHEQTLGLAGAMAGRPAPAGSQVRWRDTEARAFSATVDALTKLAALGVPIQVLLERIPGFTQEDVKRAIAIIDGAPAPPAVPATPITQPGGGTEPTPPAA